MRDIEGNGVWPPACCSVSTCAVEPQADVCLVLKVAVIMSNPEQSKHLETARMKVAGLELDLVNLRSEKYADQTSRIPTMEFGTPEEDALRWKSRHTLVTDSFWRETAVAGRKTPCSAHTQKTGGSEMDAAVLMLLCCVAEDQHSLHCRAGTSTSSPHGSSAIQHSCSYADCRRDFTINSLFYNINTREVEDFTQRGLEDLLENRMIRTPLPASETFRDGGLEPCSTLMPAEFQYFCHDESIKRASWLQFAAFRACRE